MMGPGFGAGIGEAAFACACALLVVGALAGIGCSAACGYVREHVNVEWKR